MSLKKVEQVKKDRFFKVWDVLIYGVIAVIVAALFLVIFLTGDRRALTEVEGQYNNALAFSYNFDSDELYIALPQNVAEAENSDDGITLIFCTDGGSLEEPSSCNIIYIDKSARTVAVTESDCSSRRDCVHTPAITNNSGVIVCTPHSLQIVPAGFSDPDGVFPAG